MLLHHYSDNEIKEISTKEQSTEQKHYTRPRGLWVSVVGDNDWRSYKGHDLREKYQYEITLADEAKVLFLSSKEHLSAFTKEYGLKPIGEQRIAIDWVKVATEYKGLVIAPYVTEQYENDTLFWVGAWSCASGCIWDKDAISLLKLIREAEPFWWPNENIPFRTV
jgi:hypothetical protein